jgi:hypothetical protein
MAPPKAIFCLPSNVLSIHEMSHFLARILCTMVYFNTKEMMEGVEYFLVFLSFLSWLYCPVLSVLSWLTSPGWLVMAVLSLLSYPGCPVIAVLSWLPCVNIKAFMPLYLHTTGSSAHESTDSFLKEKRRENHIIWKTCNPFSLNWNHTNRAHLSEKFEKDAGL